MLSQLAVGTVVVVVIDIVVVVRNSSFELHTVVDPFVVEVFAALAWTVVRKQLTDCNLDVPFDFGIDILY